MARGLAPPDEKRLLLFWGIWNQLILWAIAGFFAAFFNPWIIDVVVGIIVVTFIPVDFELG